MNDFEQACAEIVEEIKKSSPRTKHELNQLKLKVLNKYKSKGLKQIPKNADIYFAASEKERQKDRKSVV